MRTDPLWIRRRWNCTQPNYWWTAMWNILAHQYFCCCFLSKCTIKLEVTSCVYLRWSHFVHASSRLPWALMGDAHRKHTCLCARLLSAHWRSSNHSVGSWSCREHISVCTTSQTGSCWHKQVNSSTACMYESDWKVNLIFFLWKVVATYGKAIFTSSVSAIRFLVPQRGLQQLD